MTESTSTRCARCGHDNHQHDRSLIVDCSTPGCACTKFVPDLMDALQASLRPAETRPELWSHEEDTYTVAGEELLASVTSALGKLIDPLADQGVDAAHLTAIVTEAAQRACAGAWQRRQDWP